ncbi:condensation domain-containing protein, partial [Streptomyces sp. H27-D2]|uniref:condensation domain-containing protein n=1 Tax=Streptomyces sp. H27-D2 TaxID=3046304 RepID=UPI002DBDCB5C
MATGSDPRPTAASRQEALLRLARSRKGAGAAAVRPPVPVPAGPAPLSYAQRRMWLMDSLGRRGAQYSVPFATRVRGPLDTAALGTALTELVRRHEVLRTRYRQHEGESGRPYQDVAPPAPVPVPVVDTADDGMDLLLTEARRPFDLADGPVLRALLLRHGPLDHTVLLTFHHIAIDGGSLETVASELGTLYASARDGRPAALAAPPQYADFARAEAADADRFTDGLRYWTERLTGARPLALPRPPAGVARERLGVIHTAPLTPETLEGLRRTGQLHRSTLFTVVLAAAFAALHRATGETDLVIGCASSHREGAAMRGLVGLCVNTLPLRVDASGDPGFDTFLGRVREA